MGFVAIYIWPFSCSFVPLCVKLKVQASLCPKGGRTTLFAVDSDIETDEDPVTDPNDFLTWQREAELKTNELLHLQDEGTWDSKRFQRVFEVMRLWSQRPSRKSAVNLERLLRRVVEEKLAGNAQVDSVNMLDMYNIVIMGWARSKEKGAAQRVEEIFDTMLRLHEMGEIDIKPNAETFNGVLLAYSSSRAKDAPKQAMRVLQKLHDLRSMGRTDILPNGESYATILRAFAATEGPNAANLVLQMIRRMEKFASNGYPAVKPDYRCHNVYLNSLLAMITRDDADGTTIAARAEAHLYEMLRSEDDDSRPDVWSWNMVISAWSKSGDWNMTDRAEALVAEFENYHAECGNSTKTLPNTNTYNCLIACYSRSGLREKAKIAHAILEKMKDRHQNQCMANQRPDAVSYNSVMSAYAKSKEKDAPQKVEELLREMYEAYERSGDPWLKPSSRSFNTCVSCALR